MAGSLFLAVYLIQEDHLASQDMDMKISQMKYELTIPQHPSSIIEPRKQNVKLLMQTALYINHLTKKYEFLAPTGAQGVTLSVCLAQVCLEHSIFIFLAQILHEDFTQRAIRLRHTVGA